MYTLREFRANTKKAFDDANQGHEVVIDRAGQFFQLVSLVDLPLGGNSFASSPKAITPIKPLTPLYKPEKEIKPCKHNAHPEFCKFAKPGKPCK